LQCAYALTLGCRHTDTQHMSLIPAGCQRRSHVCKGLTEHLREQSRQYSGHIAARRQGQLSLVLPYASAFLARLVHKGPRQEFAVGELFSQLLSKAPGVLVRLSVADILAAPGVLRNEQLCKARNIAGRRRIIFKNQPHGYDRGGYCQALPKL